MMRNYEELFTDPGVFDNSGANLAEYLLSKKNTRVPERIFNLRDGQEKENEDISIRMIQRRPSKQQPGLTGRPSNSSSYSSSNATFIAFAPAGTSTPFPTGQKPSFPRKIVSVPDKCKSIQTQTSKDSSTDRPVRTYVVTHKDSLNATQSKSVQNSRVAYLVSIGNVPEDNPSLGVPPYAEEPMMEAAQERSPRPEFPEQRDSVTETYQKKCSSNLQNTSLRIRDVREMLKNTVNAQGNSLTEQKRCSVQEVVSNDESIIISDDEDSPEEEEEDSPPVTENRRTIQASQQMDMSPLPQPKGSLERSTKAPQKTITTAMSIAQDFATSSSDEGEEEPTLVPQREVRELESREEAPEGSQLKLPTPQNDVTSGFVDLSSHTSRTGSARPKDRVQVFSVNTSVIPEVAEPHSSRPSIAHQISYLQSKTSSKVIDHSGVFKAPSNIVAKRTRRKKKLESPVQRMIHLEKSIRSSIPRTQGTSRRKLYSHSLNSQEDEVEVESSEIPTTSCQVEPFCPIEEVVQDTEVEEVEIPECHVVVERMDPPSTEPKKKTRKQKKKNNIEEVEEDPPVNDVVRRSSRQRCAPKPFWLGRNHVSQQLIVQNYNEKLPLRKRYARKDDPDEVNLHSDFSILVSERNKRSKKQKKSEKKLRKNSAGEAQKQTQESDGVEPQLDAGQVDEPGPSRGTEGRKTGAKSNKKRTKQNKKVAVDSTEIQSEEPPAMSQDELFDLARNEMERARVMDFGKNSCEYMITRECNGIQVLTNGESDYCGQFRFKPGAIKRACRMHNEICYFLVQEGSFMINVDGKLRSLEKNDRAVIYKGMKYALTYLNENKQHGKISFFKH